MSKISEDICQAYDPQAFAVAGKVLANAVSQFLADARSHPEPVLPWTPPAELVEKARATLRQPLGGAVADLPAQFGSLIASYLSNINRLHSPHYMGHQVPAPIPVAALLDALGAVTNQGSATYEMGPFSTAVEKALIAELKSVLGYGENGDGIVTHGGSIANLTGLLTARNVRYPKFWKEGFPVGKKPALLAGADTHYSVAKAAGILGLGTDQVIKVGLDSERRMVPGLLESALQDAQKAGLDVFAVVGSAGSTPTGAFDPLEELAEICERRQIWFHVDGAHGASVCVSQRHRGLVKGIERGDSVVWDAHKLMFVPALMTFLFYRDQRHSFSTFQQDAPYLFDPAAPPEGAQYDGAIRTLECTKRPMALGLWAVWSLYGRTLFEQLIDSTFERTRELYAALSDAADFEVLHRPQSNILCFRYRPPALANASAETVSDFQQRLRRNLILSGRFYITSTRLEAGMALRVTLINPLTATEHLGELMTAVREVGDKLLASPPH